jgi:chromosome segregation ATPase
MSRRETIMAQTLNVICPCCDSLLVIDSDTGAILREERRTHREFQTLDDALDQVKSQHRDAQTRLNRAMQEARHREEILEKKFEEARRKASESDEPPPRPFDGD